MNALSAFHCLAREGGPRPQYLLVTADDGGENKNFP